MPKMLECDLIFINLNIDIIMSNYYNMNYFVTTDAKHDDQFSKVKFLSLVNFLLRKSIRERASYKLFSWYIYKRAITKNGAVLRICQ